MKISPAKAKELLPGVREARRYISSLPMMAYGDVVDVILKDVDRHIRQLSKIAASGPRERLLPIDKPLRQQDA